jgi:polyhydroxybutyrate depolymerase
MRLAQLGFSQVRVALTIVVSVLIGGGCSTAAPIPERTEDFETGLQVDDLLRTYQVHVPTGYTGKEPHPLLLALHGSGFGAAGMRRSTGLDTTADRHGFIVAYPDGVDGGWVWDPSFSERVDDVKFLTRLLDRLDAQLSLDPDRIYVTGFSAGGMMTQKLACSISSRLAGIAVVGATLPRRIARQCRSILASRARFAVLSILGTGDPLIPFEGDSTTDDLSLLSAAATMETWALRNGCTTPPETSTAYVDPVYGITTRQERYPGCADDWDVELYAMEGAGHIWPVTIFPANTAIAEFLLRHRR